MFVILYIYILYKMLSIVLSIYLCFVIKSDNLNTENVCLVFYRPTKDFLKFVKNLFNGCLFSSGLVIGDKLYQMRKEAKTLQKRDYTKEYITNKYLIIDTNFKAKNLQNNWEQSILSQKTRQLKTLFFKKNCLRSLKTVLNQIKNFEYKGELLPIFYLLKIKNKIK